MRFIQLTNRRCECYRRGYHLFEPVSGSLGGTLVQCKHCNSTDEYIPNVHIPKGYRP